MYAQETSYNLFDRGILEHSRHSYFPPMTVNSQILQICRETISENLAKPTFPPEIINRTFCGLNQGDTSFVKCYSGNKPSFTPSLPNSN